MTSKNLQARVVEQLNRKLNCVDSCVQTFDCQYQADSWLQRLPSSWFWFKADQNFRLTACSIYFEKGVTFLYTNEEKKMLLFLAYYLVITP